MGDSKVDDEMPDPDFKVILLGDSAVGKSKLVERYLMDDYNPRQLSTYALTLFRKEILLGDDKKMSTIGKTEMYLLFLDMSECFITYHFLSLSLVFLDFWDTAGQEYVSLTAYRELDDNC